MSLFDLNLFDLRPTCKETGCELPVISAGYGKYHKRCSYHHKINCNIKGQEHRKFRKEYCENIDGRLGYLCTAKIENAVWQLDVDHWDGNKKNIDPSNFVTFCANCHRYKTFLFGDNIKRNKVTTKPATSDIGEIEEKEKEVARYYQDK